MFIEGDTVHMTFHEATDAQLGARQLGTHYLDVGRFLARHQGIVASDVFDAAYHGDRLDDDAIKDMMNQHIVSFPFPGRTLVDRITLCVAESRGIPIPVGDTLDMPVRPLGQLDIIPPVEEPF